MNRISAIAGSVLALALLTFTLHTIMAQEVKDPVKEAARKLEKQVKEQNYKDLKEASAELVTVSRELNDEVEKSDEHVISARIFDKVEKIEKLTKKIRDKARGPY
jgi:hypothetical protein